MKNFVVKKIDECGYKRFLLWLSFESLMEYLDSIEESSNIIQASGKILIDQLFITGDEENRFISCELKNGKFDLKTARVVCPEKSFRMETVRWLHDNYCYVENSILTDCQRRSIKECIDF